MPNLRFSFRTTDKSTSLRCQCAVLPVSSTTTLARTGKALDKDSGGAVRAALKAGEFTAKVGETLTLHSTGEAARILLVGMGEGTPDRKGLLKISAAIARALVGSKAADAQFHATALKLRRQDMDWFCERLGRDLSYHGYRYGQTLSKPKPAPTLNKLLWIAGNAAAATAARKALKQGADTGAGINLARELANLPGNHCTPEHLAKTARQLARGNDKASCKVLNEKTMGELGMHSLLSVTAGTATPARLIILEYRGGAKRDAPHVLVGKGITFDSGGISLKPGAKMDEMKFDMGGAASVLGTLQAVMAMKLPINVVGIIAEMTGQYLR